MAAPDFDKQTIETLAKRAAYRCSNPDCKVSTVGPNEDPTKSTLIGEAAHIQGARQKSKRYIPCMTDAARAEITNGIWLCRNCHKLIDTDELRYPSRLIFAWRESHEKYVLSELGNNSDKLRLERQENLLSAFNEYPPIIRRIILDKPDGWEWRLAAELMKHLNAPLFRKLKDLRSGVYIKTITHIGEDDISNWIRRRISDSSCLIGPVSKLLDKLTLSFGRAGEDGNEEEIHHSCLLIRDYLAEIINYEESLYFVNVPESAEGALELLKKCLGPQMEKLAEIPTHLDEVVAMINTNHSGTKKNPLVIEKKIIFDLPKGWDRKMKKELQRLTRNSSHKTNYGCSTAIMFFLIVIIVVSII